MNKTVKLLLLLLPRRRRGKEQKKKERKKSKRKAVPLPHLDDALALPWIPAFAHFA